MDYSIGLHSSSIDVSHKYFSKDFNFLLNETSKIIKENIKSPYIDSIFIIGYKDKLKIRINNKIIFGFDCIHKYHLYFIQKIDCEEYNEKIKELIEEHYTILKGIYLWVRAIFEIYSK